MKLNDWHVKFTAKHATLALHASAGENAEKNRSIFANFALFAVQK